MSSPLSRSDWKKIIAAALLLVACEPLNPMGTCGEFDPPCADRDYALLLREGLRASPLDSTNTIDSLSFSIMLDETRDAFAAVGGGRGCAYALSCASCSMTFEADSVYFTSALITHGGDTLPAGYNFAVEEVPAGIRHFNGDWIAIDSIQGFRDSLFDVRFRGTFGGTEKSVSLSLRITNPALLLP